MFKNKWATKFRLKQFEMLLGMKVIALTLSIISQRIVSSTKKINVMVSRNSPFFEFENENGALERKIMDNFGEKIDSKINYVLANETLNEMFSSEDRFEKLSNSIKDS